jgi:L,D-peptidoglycan transpeptidase YkuD (ErfK/YbiS/YcfS/YnhG family)
MQIFVDPAGWVKAKGQKWRCALGRSGVRVDKVEGDGATPAGIWRLGRVFYRPDRLSAPATGLAVLALEPHWAWCDDASHADYNHLIFLPHPGRHEALWREDGLYDVVVEIHYNTDPVQQGRGSAIFMHVAKPNYGPTEGCIALNLSDLLDLLRLCNKEASLVIPA